MKRPDLLLVLIFFLLPVLLFWPVTLGGQTLVPADNLFAYPPWRAYAGQFGLTVPHNELLSDLLLESYVWKTLIVEASQQGQLPLWNPYLFTGVPFLAAGQHSALYPFSVLFYLLPVESAFGWFVVVQLGVAGLAMFVFMRTLGVGPLGCAVAALTYEFSAFFQVSTVFPMVVSAASWLPLLLACEVQIVRRASQGRGLLGWIILGALCLGLSLLAGHVEIAYYNLIVLVTYGMWRIVRHAMGLPDSYVRSSLKPVASLTAMALLGGLLAAVQLIPLYELVMHSFRRGSVSLADVLGWGYPLRQIATFVIPDFYGNPSHHGYFDLFARQYVAVSQDVHGNSISTIFWGVKNYVEAGSYVGILPLILALIAVIALLRGRLRGEGAHQVTYFFALALLSLLFVFGTPLYAILFYALPGFNQLHSPFRWVFPYTLSVAVLAGIGTSVLLHSAVPVAGNDQESGAVTPGVWAGAEPPAFGGDRLASLTIWSGAIILGLLGSGLLFPEPLLALADRLLRESELAQRAFPGTRAFFSYEALNIAKFAILLLASGAIVRLSRSSMSLPRRLGSIALWKPLAVVLVLVDLFLFGYDFYPAADPALLRFSPPAVQFLQQDKSLFRITSYDAPGDKTLHPNTGMLYGLQDIRGYDSIIPKQYVDWMNLIETQGELPYNRIGPLYWSGSLDSPLLDLANVKYVLTTQTLANAKLTRVYAGEINIYRNDAALPRVYLVGRASELTDFARQLRSLDPTREVLIHSQPPQPSQPSSETCLSDSTATVTKYSLNEIVVETNVRCDTWLVVADSFFNGWQATVQVAGAAPYQTPIYRANGIFRAVQLPGGARTVQFTYNPLSVRAGLYLSFTATMALLLLAGTWAWGRLYREPASEHPARRVLKNSALPMGALLLNKVIDTIFAAFMLRSLGPENAGKFAFAVVVIGYCDIFINFGLSTLVTRDVSRDRRQANRYLSNTAVVRLFLLILLAPLVAGFLWAWRSFFALSDDTTLAIILLAIALIPGGIAAALSSIFYAYEQMEYPAAVTVVTTLLKVTAGVIVLLGGLGFVGLAGTSILVNLATLGILLAVFARRFFVPKLDIDPAFGRRMLATSYPLMLNDMLSRLFFRVDVTLLQPLKGNAVVGWYTTAYKYLDGVNILPSTFTLALFPALSRYAAGAPGALLHAYHKALKYLLIVAMPLTVLSFAYADLIILIFGGPDYLPDAAIALRLLIGFVPLSFINNVTHYVLIAVNQQKYLTKAFIAGALFNIVANLIFIPAYSYRAAAVITIFSELALLIPFYAGIRKHVGAVDWRGLMWRPVLAAALMSLAVLLFASWPVVVLVPVALITYAASLALTHALDDDDRQTIALLIPARLRRMTGLVRGQQSG